MSGRRTRRMAEGSPSLRTPDHAAAQLLELLAYSGWPLTIDELRRQGVSAPAQAVYELQLAGYEIERVVMTKDGGHTGSGYRLRTAAVDTLRAPEKILDLRMTRNPSAAGQEDSIRPAF